ncbi:hypothetical protein [Paenibacillus cymbidii]|uniref:hypothetical protein n=1 Tax=Paenibacillus cymbidii TaxID=1639034 RepID=UPI0010801F3C|nr:hypothetical protein [Paenibacillus cymbidii]
MNIKQLQVGDKVKWTSQSGGYQKEKRGTVYAVVPEGVNAMAKLPRSLRSTQRKFDTWHSKYVRFIIAVPRGGKSVLVDYYCPNPGLLQLDEEPNG